MITLPKMIDASGNDCVVACTVMVCMYWRRLKPNLSWNLPLEFNSKEWESFYENGLKYVKMSGMPFNNITRFLKKINLPLDARLEFLEDMYGLRNLINLNIPPIVIYDRNYFFKNVQGIGHAAILVDYTEELFISIDPSMGPKFVLKLPKSDFSEAWKLKHNATIIIHPKTFKMRRIEIPSKETLLPYLHKGGQ
jgi:hypothetical protein